MRERFRVKEKAKKKPRERTTARDGRGVAGADVSGCVVGIRRKFHVRFVVPLGVRRPRGAATAGPHGRKPSPRMYFIYGRSEIQC